MKYNILIVIIYMLVCSSGCAQQSENTDHVLLTQLFDVVANNHLSPQKNDAQLTEKTMDSFLERLDGEKKLFTKKDVQQLQSEQASLVKAFEGGSSQFFVQTSEILKNSVERAKEYSTHYLNSELSLFEEETLESDLSKIDYSRNKKELKKHWGLLVKNQYLEKLYIAEIANPNLTFQEQKEIALGKTRLFFNYEFEKLESKTTEELVETYANSYLTNIDYQSNFLTPKGKEKWLASFNREFVGVGIKIKTTIDYPKVLQVFYDGPAWKTKKIQNGNSIIKVSDEDNQLIDVAGFPLKKVIDLLKGEKGSTVRVLVRNSDNKTEEVAIKRGKIAMSKALSFILEDKLNNRKIGYMQLPRFYAGENGSSSHIAEEVEKLKKEQVEGIIFDLRNNKGGSSREAIAMMGLFLEGGPVMQVKYADGEKRVMEDKDEHAEYSGKLVVMVNEFSSSASELFASTMQDYDRAIIVGNQTFGKGTMQSFFDVFDKDESTKFGEVKLSIGSFYSGKGRSNQYHGVTPDITFPSKNKYLKTGERKVENSLKFEDLVSSKPTNTNIQHKKSIEKIRAKSENRVNKDEYFQQVEKLAILEKNKKEKSLISLDYNTFKLEKEKLRETKPEHPPIENYIVNDLPSNEKGKTANQKTKVENDKFVYESLFIMNDYLLLDRIASKKNG